MANSGKSFLEEVHTQSVATTRILLIEDNDNNRELLSDYLRFCGYRVCSLAGGVAFGRAIEHFRPHLILLDLKLPDVDGFELLRQHQSRADWQHIPIVVVSALAFRDDQDKAFQLGARRYLVKPVRLAHLQAVIKEEISL